MASRTNMQVCSTAIEAVGNQEKPQMIRKIRESKNRKKYWKKADIADVEEVLEAKRFDERVGGDVSMRADDEIYLLDKSTDENSEQRFLKKRSNILKEPLKCTMILKQRSKVPAPIKTFQGKPDDKRKSQVQLVREQAVFKKRVEQSKRTTSKRTSEKKASATKVKCRTLNSETDIYDLWDKTNEVGSSKKTDTGQHIDVLEKPADADSLTGDQLAYYSKVTRSARPKIPSVRFQKTSLLPAVEVPKPGASYKPTFEDHQSLLLEAHEVEVNKLKREEHLERVLLSLFPTREEAKDIRIQNKVDEAVGILYSDSASDADVADDNDSLFNANPPVRAENRKTRLQRNRQKAHQERVKLTTSKKVEKKLNSQFGRIGVYKKEIDKAKKTTEEKIKGKQQKAIDAMYQPKKLGRQKFLAPDIEIKLTDELAPSLRQLKPEGSLLLDRMRSFEKRNLIEPRRKTTRKQKWTKKVYKRHFKKGDEDILTNPRDDRVC